MSAVPEAAVAGATAPVLPDGLVVVVKQECATCQLVAPVVQALAAGPGITVYSQDDPTFPSGVPVIDDRELAISWHNEIETVPTLLRVEGGREVARTIGWNRPEWQSLTGVAGLGAELPEFRPGCGSLSVDPDLVDELRVRYGGSVLHSRRVELADLEDEFEAMFERGWTDGLPVVPPTEARVMRMLTGTTRDPQDVIAIVPPDLVPVTVEKVAVNAVMAGCKPEYLPVVISILEAICTDEFNIHGVLATTMPVGPVIVVNGPIRRALGMNTGVNALGQGNRATLTIGRAVQLVIRNVGGGKPGGVDRATHGNPGKLSFCFAEDEEGSPWEALATWRGLPPGTNAVTIFPGEGPRCIVDQKARTPEELCASLALGVRAVHHPKLVMAFDAILVIGPDHMRIFRDAGWSREQVLDEITARTTRPGSELVAGADGVAEGLPEAFRDAALPKCRPGGLLLVHAGGGAGLFSAIIGGWANGATGSQPVTQAIGG